MKTLVALLGSLILVAVSGAQTTAPTAPTAAPSTDAEKAAATKKTAQTPATASTKTVPAAKTTTQAKATAPAAKATDKAAKKEEPPPKIEGITIPRPNGGFLGIQIVNSAFKLSFYDAKKKPIAPDVARAVLRWDPKYKVGQERIVLNASDDGKSLANSRTIRAPYNFKLYMSLFKDAAAGDDTSAAETHVVDFKQ